MMVRRLLPNRLLSDVRRMRHGQRTLLVALLTCVGIGLNGPTRSAAEGLTAPMPIPQFGQTYSGSLFVQGWSVPLPDGKWLVLSHSPITTTFGDIVQDRVLLARVEDQTIVAWIDIAASLGSEGRNTAQQASRAKAWCGEHNSTIKTFQISDDRAQTECMRQFFPVQLATPVGAPDHRVAARDEAVARMLKFSSVYVGATEVFEDGDRTLSYLFALSPEAYGSKVKDTANWVDGIISDPAKTKFVEAFKAWSLQGYDILSQVFHTGNADEAKRRQWSHGPVP